MLSQSFQIFSCILYFLLKWNVHPYALFKIISPSMSQQLITGWISRFTSNLSTLNAVETRICVNITRTLWCVKNFQSISCQVVFTGSVCNPWQRKRSYTDASASQFYGLCKNSLCNWHSFCCVTVVRFRIHLPWLVVLISRTRHRSIFTIKAYSGPSFRSVIVHVLEMFHLLVRSKFQLKISFTFAFKHIIHTYNIFTYWKRTDAWLLLHYRNIVFYKTLLELHEKQTFQYCKISFANLSIVNSNKPITWLSQWM